MNFKLVFRVSGKVLLVEAACMLLPLAVALLYGDDPRPLLLSAVVTAAVGGLLSLLRAKTDFFAREGFFSDLHKVFHHSMCKTQKTLVNQCTEK